MTAQHAQRQGKAPARNVAATLGHGTHKPYKHRDLGFVVDLGGWQAVANPLYIPISGRPANILTRAYHLYALPANRCTDLWPRVTLAGSASSVSVCCRFHTCRPVYRRFCRIVVTVPSVHPAAVHRACPGTAAIFCP